MNEIRNAKKNVKKNPGKHAQRNISMNAMTRKKTLIDMAGDSTTLLLRHNQHHRNQ